MGFFKKEMGVVIRETTDHFLKILNPICRLEEFINILITLPNIILQLSFHSSPHSYEKRITFFKESQFAELVKYNLSSTTNIGMGEHSIKVSICSLLILH